MQLTYKRVINAKADGIDSRTNRKRSKTIFSILRSKILKLSQCRTILNSIESILTSLLESEFLQDLIELFMLRDKWKLDVNTCSNSSSCC